MKKSKIAKIVTIIFIGLIIISIGSLVFLPQLFDLLKGDSIESFYKHTIYYQIAFYGCYLIGIVILYKLYDTFNYLYKINPFTKKIEKNLKIVAILFMILSIIVLGKSIFIPTPLTFAVIIICFIVSLCFYLLAEVIKKGILLKDEVDGTV